MQRSIAYLFSVLLFIGSAFLLSGKAFSQVNGTENTIKTTDSMATTPRGSSTYVTGITTGRARSLVGGVVGLMSLVIGWRAKIRSAKGHNVHTGAILALVSGSIGIILSIVHLSNAAGAVFGSGSGKAGAIVALVLSLTGMILGGLFFVKNK
jgi:hypothetical protein